MLVLVRLLTPLSSISSGLGVISMVGGGTTEHALVTFVHLGFVKKLAWHDVSLHSSCNMHTAGRASVSKFIVSAHRHTLFIFEIKTSCTTGQLHLVLVHSTHLKILSLVILLRIYISKLTWKVPLEMLLFPPSVWRIGWLWEVGPNLLAWFVTRDYEE